MGAEVVALDARRRDALPSFPDRALLPARRRLGRGARQTGRQKPSSQHLFGQSLSALVRVHRDSGSEREPQSLRLHNFNRPLGEFPGRPGRGSRRGWRWWPGGALDLVEGYDGGGEIRGACKVTARPRSSSTVSCRISPWPAK